MLNDSADCCIVFSSTTGRKRGAGEVGRMTRSVRQHMAAPLELLSEYPVRVVRPYALNALSILEKTYH
ncbi:hypothetical protein GQ600_25106 [Phytophthora cactorum]|nr:hypothetical protein GQ600_25106 [Phytophthora cactorum]